MSLSFRHSGSTGVKCFIRILYIVVVAWIGISSITLLSSAKMNLDRRDTGTTRLGRKSSAASGKARRPLTAENSNLPPSFRRHSNPPEVSTYKSLPLEFVHIPKTGGSSIEAAFARAGGSWGFCKFYTGAKSLKASEGAVACPDNPPLRVEDYPKKKKKMCRGYVPWHLPPFCFENLDWNLNMYQNSTLFAVVRNPYDRVISEYYFENFVYDVYKKLDPDISPSPEHLNAWAKQRLQERRKFLVASNPSHLKHYGSHGGHWIPQYEFCYSNDKQKVQHILQFENLETEFDELMQAYNLSEVKLPRIMTASGIKGSDKEESASSAKLTRDDFDDDTKQMIEIAFAQDFESFGYGKESSGGKSIEELWGSVSMLSSLMTKSRSIWP